MKSKTLKSKLNNTLIIKQIETKVDFSKKINKTLTRIFGKFRMLISRIINNTI